MKKLLLLFLSTSFFSSEVFSQIKMDSITGEVKYKKYFRINLTKVEIEGEVYEWVLEKYKKEVLINHERIIHEGVFNIKIQEKQESKLVRVYYTSTIAFKNKRVFIDNKINEIKSNQAFIDYLLKYPTNSKKAYRDALIRDKKLEIANTPAKLNLWYDYNSKRDKAALNQINDKYNEISKSLFEFLKKSNDRK